MKAGLFVLSLVLILSACGSDQSAPETDDSSSSADTAADGSVSDDASDELPDESRCGPNEVDAQGTCVRLCDGQNLCPGELMCISGICGEQLPEQGSPCGEAAVQVGETCVDTCDEASDCGDALVCRSGVCVDAEQDEDDEPALPGCPQDQVSHDGECLPLCDSDAACGAGRICLESLCRVGSRPSITLISPTPDSTIGLRTDVVIRFDSAMDPASLHLTGALAEAADREWTTSVLDDDTLHLSPETAWPGGPRTLILDVASSGGVALPSEEIAFTIDAAVATVGAEPASGANLRPDEAISVRFSKSMDPTSLALSGDMAAEAGFVWEETAAESDTLVLEPLTTWSDGAARRLTVTAFDRVGNPAAELTQQYQVDASTPQAEVTPRTGSALTGEGEIVVLFTKTMDPHSLVIGGDLAAQADAAWSTTEEPNDTLTLSPILSWPGGTGLTLEVDASDLFGNPLPTLDLTFDVDLESPYALVGPASGSQMAASSPVVVLFSETMDRESLALSGSLAGDVDEIVWTNTVQVDDTVTLKPDSSGWELPGGLTIDAVDIVGNPLTRLDLDYYGIGLLPIIDVPVHAVRVADDDGSRAADITPEQVALWVAEANRAYAVAGVHFSFDPDADGPDWSEVDETLINQMTGIYDAQWTEERAAANAEAANHPGKVTVFFRHGPDAGPTGGGFSWTDYNFIAMPGFDHTWLCGHQNIVIYAHEMGHFLGLAHTFSGQYASHAEAETAFNDNGRDPSHFDGDMLISTPPDPFIRGSAAECDTSITSITLDGVPFLLPRHNIMSYYDSAQMTISPDQIFAVRQGALVRTGQSLTQLLPGNFVPAIQGEALVSGASATGGFTISQTNMREFLGNWSGDAQLFWGDAGLGDTLELGLSAPEAGTYRVFATLTQAPDFGIFRFFINGHPAGESVDTFGRRVILGPPRYLGTHQLRAGSNTLEVEAIGTHPEVAPDEYTFGLDHVLLERID